MVTSQNDIKVRTALQHSIIYCGSESWVYRKKGKEFFSLAGMGKK